MTGQAEILAAMNTLFEARQPGPDLILCGREPYAELTWHWAHGDALAAGKNWRRAKREGRKAKERYLRDTR